MATVSRRTPGSLRCGANSEVADAHVNSRTGSRHSAPGPTARAAARPARISHRIAKRGRGDAGSDKANASQDAQVYLTVRRAPWPRSTQSMPVDPHPRGEMARNPGQVRRTRIDSALRRHAFRPGRSSMERTSLAPSTANTPGDTRFAGGVRMVYQFDSRQVRTPRNISLTTRTKVKPRHYRRSSRRRGRRGRILSASAPPAPHNRQARVPCPRHAAVSSWWTAPRTCTARSTRCPRSPTPGESPPARPTA